MVIEIVNWLQLSYNIIHEREPITWWLAENNPPLS